MTAERPWLQVVRDVEREAPLRRMMSAASATYYDTHYCQKRFARHRDRWLTRIDGAWREAQASRDTPNPIKSKVLMVAPRGHGKTTAVLGFTARAVCEDRNIRVLLVCATEPTAKKRLSLIKDTLTSPAVESDWCSDPELGFGPFLPRKISSREAKTRWGARQIQVLRTDHHVDPTIEAVGLGSKGITGGHFDLIILDDPESYKSVKNAAMRRELRRWLSATVLPMLDPGGMIVVIGTRKHSDDLYGHLLEDETWTRVFDRAIPAGLDSFSFKPRHEVDEHGRQNIVGWDIEGEVEVLWPEERPIQFLLTEREGMCVDDGMGYTNFEREYQGNTHDESESLFPISHLRAARDRGRNYALYRGDLRVPSRTEAAQHWPSDLLIVQGWDPAFTFDKKRAEEGDTSYCVGVTWAASVRTRDRWLLGLWRERGRTHRQKKLDVVREYRRWAPDDVLDQSIVDMVRNGWCFAVAMEKNNAGEFLRVETEEIADIPLIPHLTGSEVSDPFKGVPALSSLFERGRVVLPSGDPETRAAVEELMLEFNTLGSGAHNDIVMAVWVAEVLLRRALKVYDNQLEMAA